MSNFYIKKNVVKKVRGILEEKGIKSLPINLVEILDFLDLEYKGFDPYKLNLADTDPNKVSAFFDYNDSLILYNIKHPKTRLRFSIGHEIGHYILGHNSYPHPEDYDPKDPKEIECNLFSAELLMPSSLMKYEETKTNVDVIRLAKKYRVSEDAMRYRIMFDDRLIGNDFDPTDKYQLTEEEIVANSGRDF